MDELISVIINVYNGERFISKCLESVLNQTYKNIEILIINDGSTDKTLEICENYTDERIRILSQENKGLSLSRNVGIENAKGNFLYFVDVDDYIERDVIEYLYDLYKKYKTPICTCSSIDIFDYQVSIKNKSEKIEIIDSEEMLKKILLLTESAVTIWNKLIRKDLFNNVKFEDRKMNDLVVTYKLAILANKITYSNQIKYYYLHHKNSITAKGFGNIDRCIDYYNASLERYDYIKKLYPNLLENDIFMIRIIATLYLVEDKRLEDFLMQKNALNLYKKLFTFKVFICRLKYKEKIKLLLLYINVNLCRAINRKYQSKNYKYKL